MRILLINPNSSDLVTKTLEEAVKPLQYEHLQIDVICCKNMPQAIVTAFDELMAGVASIQLLQEKEDAYDGAIIGCFADPGLRGARELVHIPVAGLFESSTIFAKLQGRRYSVLASGDESDISPWIGSIRDLGDRENAASVRYINSTVEKAVSAKEEDILCGIEACRKEDGADAVILGCAAFAGRGKELSAKAGIPVIDGIEEAVRMVEMMVHYRKEAVQ